MKILLLSIAIFLSEYLTAQPGNTEIAAGKQKLFPAEKTIVHKLGNKKIPIRMIQYGDSTGIICINLHDNETTSVEAAKSVLEEKGGTLIKIENKQQRIIRFKLKGILYSFDPNRIFSKVGIEKTLKATGKISRDATKEVEKFARKILQLLPDSLCCIIALHNNTEEAFSAGSYLPGGENEMDTRAIYTDSLQDADDFMLTTDSLLFRKMADSGYNSIWQDNEKAKKDGSLSIYCGERDKRYVNIETQHGKTEQYREMLQKLLAILEEEKNQPPETSVNSQ